MLKIISTLFITSTLSCTVYGAAPAAEPAFSGKPLQQSQHYEERAPELPSTEALGIFLKQQFPTEFPINIWQSFSEPFSNDFSNLSRADQLKAMHNALDNIGKMVALASVAFSNVIQSQQQQVPVFRDMAAPRVTTFQNYHSHAHPCFLRFQAMIKKLLLWAKTINAFEKDAADALNKRYGLSSIFGFCWIHDNNGIVPMPLMGDLKKTIYIAAMPYGDWGDRLQRSMVFVDGKLILAPCINITEYNEGSVYKFVHEQGEPSGFVTYPLTLRISNQLPEIKSLLENGILRKTPDGNRGVIIMPNTSEESEAFEAALFEAMIDAAKNIDSFASQLIIKYGNGSTLQELPDDDDIVVPDAATQQNPLASSIDAVQRHIDSLYDSLYEQKVQAEQAAVTAAVASRTAHLPLQKVKGKKKLTKDQSAPPSSDSATQNANAGALAAKKAEILAQLKTQGRQKWGSLVKLIMGMLSPHMHRLDFNTRGSHLSIHIKGEKESDGLTLIKPHGRKGGEVPARVGQGLASQLVNLVMKLSTTSTE